MDSTSRLDQIRSGFSRTFWVANVLELFERFAFYGSKAVLAVYLVEKIGLGVLGNTLVGLYGFAVFFLPILAGPFVDRYGFRRSLAACFSIFSLGYFAVGLAGLEQGSSFVSAVGVTPYTIGALLLTAIGGSLIKPCIVGTVARTTTDETKSLGYSIYYTLVNLGGALGPLLALPVREGLGIEYVLVMSAAVSALNLLGTLAFFREPGGGAAGEARTLGRVLRDMVLVFRNARFMTFLVIFSGFWIMFWQIFYSLPFYVRDVLGFERFEIIETVDAWTIILVTVVATALAKRLKPITAMTLGFALATVSWLLIVYTPPAAAQVLAWPLVFVINLVLRLLALLGLPVATVELTAVIAPAVFGLMVFAIGEAIQAPRFYEYVADLAPREQVGPFMGFAFLPVAIGALVAGPLSGWLIQHFMRDQDRPAGMWVTLAAIGFAATALMLLYDRLVARRRPA